MPLKPTLCLFFSIAIITGCGESSDHQRLAAQGLPPSGYRPSLEQGRDLYQTRCAHCHGKQLGGSDKAPPLRHKYYKPDHHADLAFYRAIKDGVIAHHWPFGNMPPQPGVSPTDAADIILYVRDRQQKLGLY